MNHVSLLMISLTLPFLASAREPNVDHPCIYETEIDIVRKKIEFENAPGATEYKHCDQSNIQYKTYAGLSVLGVLTDLKVRKDEFDHGILTKDPVKFFYARVRKVIFEADADNFCKSSGAAAYVLRDETELGIVHVCPKIAESPVYTVAESLLHESRHLDGIFHVQCIRGTFKGEWGCDESYEQGGAYGVGIELGVKVSRSDSIIKPYRKLARARALGNLVGRMNGLLLGLKEGVAIAGADRHLVFYDGGKPVRMGESIPRGFKLTSYHGLPYFINTKKRQGLTYLEKDEFPTEDISTPKYLEKLDDDEVESLVDFYQMKTATCMLLKNEMKCFAPGKLDEMKEIAIPGKEAVSFVFTESSTMLYENKLFVVDTDGEYWEVPATWDELKEASGLVRAKTQMPIKSLSHLTGPYEVAVTLDGQVLLYDRRTEEMSPAPHLKDFKADRMVGKRLWSKTLEKL